MMKLPSGLLVTTVVGLAAVAIACGSDGDEDERDAEPTATAGGADATATVEPSGTSEASPDLQEYFQQLDQAENAYRSASDAADDQLAALTDETVSEAPDILRQLQEAMAGFVRALEAIDPPADAAAAHEETIAGFQAASALVSEALPDIESAQTVDEAFAPFASPQFVEVSTALDATCLALQALADSNAIQVDLSCDVQA
jgi:hypothetical protein